MTDRRAELEKKRLKLQQLRELKEARRQEKESGRVLIQDLGLPPSSSASGLASPNRGGPASLNTSINSDVGDSLGGPRSSIRADITEVDDILKSVGIHAGQGRLSWWLLSDQMRTVLRLR